MKENTVVSHAKNNGEKIATTNNTITEAREIAGNNKIEE